MRKLQFIILLLVLRCAHDTTERESLHLAGSNGAFAQFNPGHKQAETLSVQALFQQLREAAQNADVTSRGDLIYGPLTTKIQRFEAVDLLHGEPSKRSGEGCARVGWNQHQIRFADSWCPGRSEGLTVLYLSLRDLRVVVPWREALNPLKGAAQGTEFGISPSERCFIVPHAGDSLHLLIRTRKQPSRSEFRSVSERDVTSIHLLGQDLETRIQMRFENGKEYYVAHFVYRDTSVLTWTYPRERNLIQSLGDTRIGDLRTILMDIYAMGPPDRERSVAIPQQKYFVWERDLLDRYRGDRFLDRTYDSQRPFPLENED
ncbi:MAG: hypothetical protein AAF998_13165 [Bacteroidota bacterium]